MRTRKPRLFTDEETSELAREYLESARNPQPIDEPPPPLINKTSLHVMLACSQVMEAIARIDEAQDKLDDY